MQTVLPPSTSGVPARGYHVHPHEVAAVTRNPVFGNYDVVCRCGRRFAADDVQPGLDLHGRHADLARRGALV